jgi:hypothetical protein
VETVPLARLYLPGNMDNDRARQLMHMTGKATLQGERLEQQAESETSRASLVRQELELIGQKRPVLSQLIMRPLPLHRQAPSVGENGRAAYREVLGQDR